MKSYKDKELVKKLDNQLKQRRNLLKVYRAKNKIEISANNELRNQSELEIKKVMKRIKLSDCKNADSTDNLIDLIKEEKMNKNDEENANQSKKVDNTIMDIIQSKLDSKLDESASSESEEQSEKNESISNNLDEEEEDIVIEDFELDSESDNKVEEDEINETSSTEQIENNSECEEEEEEINCNENEDNCSIDANDLEMNRSSSENELSKIDLKAGSTNIEKASEDYLKSQLIKAFGEKLANKNSNKDISSDEEWDDDFFINKKVKKFKSTIVDIERYKDLEEKEKGYLKRVEEEDDAEEAGEEAKPKKFKKNKTVFKRGKKFN